MVLVVLGLYLEVCLRMVADGALIRSFLADDDMAAVSTLPDDVAVLSEYAFFANVVKKFPVALFVGLFNGGNPLELLGYLVEALFAGLTGHTGIHIRPLEVFATGSGFQILGS